MRLRLHSEADAELQNTAQWYEVQVKGLGEHFLSEAIDAFLDIENHPQRFARASYHTTREIRRRMLAHFPYSVV